MPGQSPSLNPASTHRAQAQPAAKAPVTIVEAPELILAALAGTVECVGARGARAGSARLAALS